MGRISKATTYKKINAEKIMQGQKCRPLGDRPVPPHHLAPLSAAIVHAVENQQAIDRCQCATNNAASPWNIGLPCRFQALKAAGTPRTLSPQIARCRPRIPA